MLNPVQSSRGNFAHLSKLQWPHLSMYAEIVISDTCLSLSCDGASIKVSFFQQPCVKPKIHFLDSAPPRKQNMNRESNNARKGQVKKTSESASFKSIRSGYSNAESIKTQSIHPPQAEDHRGLKERIAVEKKISMPECPLVKYAPVASTGNLHSKVDPEVGTVSESKVLGINRGLQDKDYSGKIPFLIWIPQTCLYF